MIIIMACNSVLVTSLWLGRKFIPTNYPASYWKMICRRISWPNRFQGFVANVPRSPNHHVFSRPVLVGIIRKNLWYNLCTNQAFKHHFSSWFSASLWGIVGPIWNPDFASALEKSSSWSRVKPDAIACLIILTKHLGIKTSSHCYNVGPPFSISKLEKIYPVTLVNECLWCL